MNSWVVQIDNVKHGSQLLIILDGFRMRRRLFFKILQMPTMPKCPPDNSHLGKLLYIVSYNTTILITSRPDSSLDLHNRANVNRVEILGFTKESIHDYFQEALSTLIKDEIAKLNNHFRKYPAIESSCYIPLNAAFLYTHISATQPHSTHHPA